jgi:prolyl 4-hydroxylase
LQVFNQATGHGHLAAHASPLWHEATFSWVLIKLTRKRCRFETHYDFHYANPRPVDRITSFFATLEASDDIEGGSTWFPMVLQPAWKDKQPWCRWLDCSYQRGLAVRPIPGNAVFWVNFRKDGTGHRETAHGGQPVLKGSKIGLNIWTRGKVNGYQ